MPLPPPQKTGRNDPCPCGSGKKYKQCCLKDAVTAEESPWSQQREASGRLVQQMLNFARQRFAKDLLAAWLDFNEDDSPSRSKKIPRKGRFLFPICCSTGTRNHARAGGHPSLVLSAQSYLLKMGSRLPDLERLILEQGVTQPLSFYEVVRCDPGEGIGAVAMS